ncbi:hypothetical protein evm_004148 [Chilo suppressalis]|nr:hypothetical protein evm_004148 [Chilo suppressalis]
MISHMGKTILRIFQRQLKIIHPRRSLVLSVMISHMGKTIVRSIQRQLKIKHLRRSLVLSVMMSHMGKTILRSIQRQLKIIHLQSSTQCDDIVHGQNYSPQYSAEIANRTPNYDTLSQDNNSTPDIRSFIQSDRFQD